MQPMTDGLHKRTNRPGYRDLASSLTLLLLAILACGPLGSTPGPSEPEVPVAPITLGGDLSAIDLCQAIPKEDIEAVMGRKLVSAPERFDYYETPGASGCQYVAGKDSDGEAHFGYVVLTPIEAYNQQPLYLDVEVSDIGQAAYFNNGADARQLWVKVNDQVAFVVAFGDVPNETGALAIAELVVAAIR
jgi:hypothetical protein